MLSGMGALWTSRQAAAYKSYTSVLGQFNFLLNYFDMVTGAHHVMPAAVITQVRTAAMTAWAATKICCTSPRKLALFGPGLHGRSHLEALQETLCFSEIAVADTANVSGACAEYAMRYGIPTRQVQAQVAVTNADLVVTVTRSRQPVLDGHWLKPGAGVCAVGTSLPSGTEIDAVTRQRCNRVVVEWKPQSMMEAGEIVMGLSDGSLSADRIFDIGELENLGVASRERAEDSELFKAVGIGLSDLVAARLAVLSLAGR